VIVDFIREHADHQPEKGLRWGVEPICAVLSEHGVKIAPSTYYEWKDRLPSRRAERDVALLEHIRRIHQANFGVYGPRKVWLVLNREGIPVARCTIERLMRQAGLAGAVRGKVKRTTIAGIGPRPDDLVKRNFEPTAPNRLWVADFTYVSTWAGWTYVAFVIDAYARRILGWRTATSMTADLVLDAIEQAIWTREYEGRDQFDDLVAHNDRGVQYLSVAYSERLGKAGIQPSVGAVGSSYDNALAESINGLYKTELIRRFGPWRSVDAVEIATAEWVDWYNHRRLHEYAGDITPAELEHHYYDQAQQPVGSSNQ
jgi:putative transposase